MAKAVLTDNKDLAPLLPVCALCEEVPARGIRGGYMLNKSFICNDCEKRILDTPIGTAQYQEILALIKRIIK